MNLKYFKNFYMAITLLVLGVNATTNNSPFLLSWDYILLILSMIILFPLAILILVRKNFLVSGYGFFFGSMASLIILTWLFSIFMGIYYDNNVIFAIRNNAGIIAYLWFFIGIALLDRDDVLRLLLAGGSIMLATTLILKAAELLLGVDVTAPAIEAFFGRIVGSGGIRFGRIFIYSQYLITVPIVFSIFKLFSEKKYKPLYLLIFMSGLYAMGIVSMSKGMVLALAFGLAFAVMVAAASNKNAGKANIIVVQIFVLLAMVALVALPDTMNPLSFVTSKNDISNVARYDQVNHLIDQFTLLGRGSGATIPGYNRDDNLSYGFELSYLAAIHKFGVFSVFPFLSYVLTMIAILNLVIRGKMPPLGGAMAGASMSFLMPAIGNPGLFSVQEVVTHGLVLIYITRCSELGMGNSGKAISSEKSLGIWNKSQRV